MSLYFVMGMPTERAAISLSRMALMARPARELTRFRMTSSVIMTSRMPMVKGIPGFIFEFKHTKDINVDLDSLANSALKQIEDMKYDTELNDFGVEDIVKIGIAFRQKSAVVKRG